MNTFLHKLVFWLSAWILAFPMGCAMKYTRNKMCYTRIQTQNNIVFMS